MEIAASESTLDFKKVCCVINYAYNTCITIDFINVWFATPPVSDITSLRKFSLSR